MTIAEIKQKLSEERTFGNRYPARIIFTESLEAYASLESQLKGICDVTINVADFCKAPDTVPQFEQLKRNFRLTLISKFYCSLLVSTFACVPSGN